MWTLRTIALAGSLFIITSTAAAQGVVKVFGNWRPDGYCVQQFSAAPHRQLSSGACNDKTSGVEVPFGMSVEICEHDGQGSPDWVDAVASCLGRITSATTSTTSAPVFSSTTR